MKRIRLSIIALLIGLLVAACSDGGGSSSSDSGGGSSLVTVSVSADIQGSVASQSITSIISKLAFTISASDISTITKSVDVSGSSEVTESFSIDNGKDRRFCVEAIGSSGEVLYSGSTTVNLDGSDVTLSITMTATDSTAPLVVSISPESGASGVPVSSPVTITFSETIDPGTLSYSFSSASGPVPCSVSVSGAIATFTPSSALEYSAEYKVMINAGVSDTAGNVMSGPYYWAFTTSAYPDTTPPAVTAVSPGRNASSVLSSAKVAATFSEAVDPASINAGTFTLKNGTGSPVAGTVTYGGLTAVFTPSSALSSKTTYSATVSTGVRDLAGNYMASNYLWQFKTKGWINPASLADNISPDGQDVYGAQVAMDSHGNAIVVWQQYYGAYSYIYKAEYRGGVWTYPSSLADHISPDGIYATNPQVAMDDNGNAIITWYDGAGSCIYKAEYRGGVWTYPLISDYVSPDGTNSYGSKVAMDNNGNAIITWAQGDGIYDQIFKSEYRGGAWTNPSSLSDNISPDGQSAYAPQVTMGNDGSAIITWYQGDSTGYYQVFKAEYRGGAWTYPASLNDNISPSGQYAQEPSVAMDSNGNAIIVWYEYDGISAVQIYEAECRGGVWTYPSSLSDNISPDGQSAANTQVAMDDNGNAIVTWVQSDGVSSVQIFKAEYRGGAWTYPASLADNISTDGQYSSDPKVAMDNNGGAIITWFQWDDTYNNIYKAEYRSGAWAYPVPVASHIDTLVESAPDPQVAMGNNGNAIIVWPQWDGTGIEQVFKSEFR